jgi:hypothetical protein
MSILSAVNAVNLVNTVNDVKKSPPSGGVATTPHEFTFTLISKSDFGEITDNQRPPTADVWVKIY